MSNKEVDNNFSISYIDVKAMLQGGWELIYLPQRRKNAQAMLTTADKSVLISRADINVSSFYTDLSVLLSISYKFELCHAYLVQFFRQKLRQCFNIYAFCMFDLPHHTNVAQGGHKSNLVQYQSIPTYW